MAHRFEDIDVENWLDAETLELIGSDIHINSEFTLHRLQCPDNGLRFPVSYGLIEAESPGDRNSSLLEAIKPYDPTNQITVDLFILGGAYGHGN